MSEKEQASSRQLEKEAATLRRQLAERSQILQPVSLSIWKKMILLVLLVGMVTAAVYLLIFKETRRQLLVLFTDHWMAVYSGRNVEILALPPPPPREVEPQVRYPDVFSSSEQEFKGVLYSSSASPAPEEENKEVEEEPGFVNPAKTEESEAAYDFLIRDSETARKLSENALAEYEFREWKPVRVDPPLFLIDLLVTRKSDNRELHLVWEVNLEEATTKPLSQAARDLGRS